MWPLTSSHWLTLGPTAPSSPGMPGIPAAPSGPGSPWKTTHELKTSRSLCSFYRTCFIQGEFGCLTFGPGSPTPLCPCDPGSPGKPWSPWEATEKVTSATYSGIYRKLPCSNQVVTNCPTTKLDEPLKSPWITMFYHVHLRFQFFFKCNTLKGTMLHNEYFYFSYFKNILLVILLYKAGTLSIY